MISKIFMLQNLKNKLSTYQLISLLLIITVTSCNNCNSLTIRSGLSLDIEKTSLAGQEKTIEVGLCKDEGYCLLSEENFKLKVTIEEELGGSGSTLEYVDAEGIAQNRPSIDEPLAHFIQGIALPTGDDRKQLAFTIKPGENVIQLVVVFAIYDVENACIAETRRVKWIETDQDPTMLKKIAVENLNDFTGDEKAEFKLKNKEDFDVSPCDITVTLESNNAAQFELMDQYGNPAGSKTTLETLLGNNDAIHPHKQTAPIQFQVTHENGETEAIVTLTLKQGHEVITTQKIKWTKEVLKDIQLEMQVKEYVPGSNQMIYTVTNKTKFPIEAADHIKLYCGNIHPANKAKLQVGGTTEKITTIALENIPAHDQITGTLNLDFCHETSAEFAFKLYKEAVQLGNTQQVICGESIDLKFGNLLYNKDDNKLHYQVSNTGANKTGDKVVLHYQSADLGAELDGKQTGSIDLGQIASNDYISGALAVDLGANKEATFEFSICYGTDTTPIDTRSITCKINFEITAVNFKEATNEVSFKVRNTGNVNATTGLGLSYVNSNPASNKAQLSGNNSIAVPIKVGEVSDEQILELDFKGERDASFNLMLDYQGNKFKKLCGFGKLIDLGLVLAYDKTTNQVTYAVTNKSSYPVIDMDKINLEYVNMDAANGATLQIPGSAAAKSNRIALKNIAATSQVADGLTLDLGGEPSALFGFTLYYDGTPLLLRQQIKCESEVDLSKADLDLSVYYDKTDSKIHYKIENKGTQKTDQEVNLHYEGNHIEDCETRVSLGKINGKETKEGTITTTGFLGDKFTFKLFYGTTYTGKSVIVEHKVVLKIIELNFDPGNKKVTFRIENTGTKNATKLLRLSYKNQDQRSSSGNKAKLGSNPSQLSSLAPLEAGEKSSLQEFPVQFLGEREATFSIHVRYGENPGDEQEITCKNLPAIKLTGPTTALSGNSFQLTLTNSSGFPLIKEDLDQLLLSYKNITVGIVPSKKATLQRSNDTAINNQSLSSLLGITSLMPGASIALAVKIKFPEILPNNFSIKTKFGDIVTSNNLEIKYKPATSAS